MLIAGGAFGYDYFTSAELYTPDLAPIANAGTDQNIYLGQTALLNGSASTDPGGSAITYKWKLDAAPAGSVAALVGATTAKPSLVPDVVGSYHISLVVNNGMYDSAASTLVINVSLNLPPVATAKGNTVNPVTGSAPLQVVFDASGSYDPEKGALSYSWNFGDPASGINNTGKKAFEVHTYSAVGNYTAVVTVTDNTGKTDQASVAITVSAPNALPVISPTATPSNGMAPLSVQFAANASDANPDDVLSYLWNFGDGSPVSTLANPQHTYAAGAYTATLKVSDGVNEPVSARMSISAGSVLAIDVTEAMIQRGEKGKVEGKISLQADFKYSGIPLSGDIVMVKFDDMTLLNIPFGNFQKGASGLYKYETATQGAEIDFTRKTIKVSNHKLLTNQVDNSNGIDVVICFGDATGTDNFVMISTSLQKDNQDSDLTHKKEGKHN